jgi:hypothetical protein
MLKFLPSRNSVVSSPSSGGLPCQLGQSEEPGDAERFAALQRRLRERTTT